MTEKQPAKLYYSIGEVAAMFDVNTSLIRFWEKEFDVIKPHKNRKGNRLFSPADVDNFHLIYHLVKEKGMTLKGAAAQLKERREDTEQRFIIIKRLKLVKEELLAIRARLGSDPEDRDNAADEPGSAAPDNPIIFQ
jgi:DNA-binding transcriptional MerR regulator